MVRTFVFCAVSLLTATVLFADAALPAKITLKHGRLLVGTDNPNALELTVPANVKTLHVECICDDALLYDPAKGKATEARSVDVPVAADGRSYVSVDMKQSRRVAFQVVGLDGSTQIANERFDIGSEGRDDRDATSFSFYTGMVIDSFASSAYNEKFNKDVTSAVKTKPIFGIDFEHRFLRGDHVGEAWVYGEALHSARTAQVACNSGNVKDAAGQKSDTNNPCTTSDPNISTAGDYNALLRTADSTEAFMGLRWEPPHSLDNDSVFYAKLQLGFLTIAGDGNDVIDNHHIGVGIMKTAGKLRDSYIEAGYGRSDLFATNRHHRWKFDGYVTFDPGFDKNDVTKVSLMTPFIQMTVDSDFKSGPDSVQIFAGFNIALDKLKVSATQ
jgi:hypothetical protein